MAPSAEPDDEDGAGGMTGSGWREGQEGGPAVSKSNAASEYAAVVSTQACMRQSGPAEVDRRGKGTSKQSCRQ
jgi:hypothetical protein